MIKTKELCDELFQMLDEMPTYTSWGVQDLEKVFLRYKEIVRELIAANEFLEYQWLVSLHPGLHDRIRIMLAEIETEKQNQQFNSIAYELRCSIEVLTGNTKCTEDQWPAVISGKLPPIG